MKPVNVVLLGAGSRGTYAYGEYARRNPKMLKIIAVAEPNEAKRKNFQIEHNLPEDRVFSDWEEAFAKMPEDAEGVIIATQDKMHAGPLSQAMARNMHILCEKPIVPTFEECRDLEKKSGAFTKTFMIGHVLKYTSFFSKIYDLLKTGRIGNLIGISLAEHVGHIHISHSFVRGNWRNTGESSPMILAKSCHDMDMLHWLAGAPCESLSSFGDLHYFKPERAPKDAPLRCLDGCPHQSECPYHVSKIYLGNYTGWPVNVIATDLSMEGRIKALETGPYGRCVFHCDNDVVDHQTVSLRFRNGVLALFTMSGFTMETTRNIGLFGTAGEITGNLEKESITVKDFSSKSVEEIRLGASVGGHSGGDPNLIADFVNLVRNGKGHGRTSVKNSFESHYMAFAAEHSRLNKGKIVIMEDFKPI